MRVHLELAAGTETLEGSVSLGGAAPRTFIGWIGLNAVLDALLAQESTTCVALWHAGDTERVARCVASLTDAGATVREFTGPEVIGLVIDSPDPVVLDSAGFEPLAILQAPVRP